MIYLANDYEFEEVADAIRRKTGTEDPLKFPDDYVNEIDKITTGVPAPYFTGVRFLNYNGDILEEWDIETALNATELPAFPTLLEEFATSNYSWSWSLQEIKDFLEYHLYGNPAVYVAIDCTSDYNAIFEMSIPNNVEFGMILKQSTSGTYSVDWGDGTSATGTSSNTSFTHTYTDNKDVHYIKVTTENQFYPEANTGGGNTMFYLGTLNSSDKAKFFIQNYMNGVIVFKNTRVTSFITAKYGNLKYLTVMNDANNSYATYNLGMRGRVETFIYNSPTFWNSILQHTRIEKLSVGSTTITGSVTGANTDLISYKVYATVTASGIYLFNYSKLFRVFLPNSWVNSNTSEIPLQEDNYLYSEIDYINWPNGKDKFYANSYMTGSYNKIVIPSSVENIDGNVYSGQCNINEIIFQHKTTAPTFTNTSIFLGANQGKIYEFYYELIDQFVTNIGALSAGNTFNLNYNYGIGYGKFTKNDTLPNITTDQKYSLTWHDNPYDAVTNSNEISAPTKTAIYYCSYTAL